MTSSSLLRAIATALRMRVKAADGGVLETAESLEEAQDFLAAAPSRWRLVLLWEGYGSHPAAREGMATHQVSAVIQQVRGLGAERSIRLLAFAERIEQVSGWMRALRFPDGANADAAGFSLSDSRWLETVKTSRAHMLTFSLAAALPPFSETIPLTFE